MKHVPLDSAFKCARLDASYVCLSCRLKSKPLIRYPKTSPDPSIPPWKRRRTEAKSPSSRNAASAEEFDGTYGLYESILNNGGDGLQASKDDVVQIDDSLGEGTKYRRVLKGVTRRHPGRQRVAVLPKFERRLDSDILRASASYRDLLQKRIGLGDNVIRLSGAPDPFAFRSIQKHEWKSEEQFRAEREAQLEKQQAEKIFGALEAHGMALEGTGEGLKPWQHLQAEAEDVEEGYSYQPFSDLGDNAYEVDESRSQEVQELPSSTPVVEEDSDRLLHPSDSHQLPEESQIRTESPRTPQLLGSRLPSIPFKMSGLSLAGTRFLHTSARARQQAATASADVEPDSTLVEFLTTHVNSHKFSHIRQQLRQWQDDNGNPAEDTKPQPLFDGSDGEVDGILNSMTRIPDMNTALHTEEGQNNTTNQLPTSDTGDGLTTDSSDAAEIFLNPGDLVELDYDKTERNNIVAVFVQRIPGNDAQFFTMQGRWVFMKERSIVWSLPAWASKAELAPLLEYLPKPIDQAEMEEVMEKARVVDLSVPRTASAPLVRRLVKFYTESQEIYRKHASVLDNAHNLLAHETDLRYGSLVSAASTLLQIPVRELPVTALFAVRTALGRAPLAFNIDRRSHRMTGYLQIKSKEQVRMAQYVRDWLRDWQDDVAAQSQANSQGKTAKMRKHRTSRGAQYIYSFVEKARRIVLKSREDREVLPAETGNTGNIGISKKRFPISDDSQAVRISQDTQFTEQDVEIVRFLEGWCASGTLVPVREYAGLLPMVVQATGLYSNFETVNMRVAFTFLQELGVLLPYENRVRFDSHLLLPSSQHSKPLQNLMDNLIKMQNNHNFTDSMKGLRKDWGNLPVFCVDEAGAQEIDDGVSIEPVEGKEGEYWLHTHIANPTAFFERDHSLAKMARHMGESIYFPERTYMMLPRWATSGHFSLAKDRPCITFSTRVNSNADALERKVTSGIIRSVLTLTPSEITNLVGEKDIETQKSVYTVGGEPPPETVKKSMVDHVTEQMVQSLKTMKTLAEHLKTKRISRGGMVYDNKENEIAVWQSNKGQGLAWDHPWRRGSRTVEGDPVIQMKTNGFTNWFAPKIPAGVAMVREMMLLAGETAAAWCSERGIPAIFRGTVRRPDDPDAEAFSREVVMPAIEEHGEIPSYIGMRYFAMQGTAMLRTSAFPHRIAGLEQYVKTTSPLRRYGDMIVHWQIEAALREEARRGRSLTPEDINRDASFLPFSSNVLRTIMLGLGPREHLIARAKTYSRDFWMMMLMFRAHHFKECELPFAATPDEQAATAKPLMQVFVTNLPKGSSFVSAMATSMNLQVMMHTPRKHGLGEVRRGDAWEVEVEYIDVYERTIHAKPLRLVDRPVDERLEKWIHLAP